jgi:hypothetical protein
MVDFVFPKSDHNVHGVFCYKNLDHSVLGILSSRDVLIKTNSLREVSDRTQYTGVVMTKSKIKKGRHELVMF